MQYIQVQITIENVEDFHKDLLADALGEIDFETFEETPLGLCAYIKEKDWDKTRLQEVLNEMQTYFQANYKHQIIPYQNWNKIWEDHFEPLIIANKCYVRATFHKPNPIYPYEIVIDPKMAFGTGHHQTTSLMMEYILELNLKNKNVLDMGCGTGILGILASKLDAKKIVAIDYDTICYESVLENVERNNITNIVALCGSKESIPSENFDIILANINRNILIDQIEKYANVLNKEGLLIISGFFLSEDFDILKDHAEHCSLKFVSYKEKNNWCAAMFQK